jgi:hypothetical protein
MLGLFLWSVIAWMKYRNRTRAGVPLAKMEPAVALEA